MKKIWIMALFNFKTTVKSRAFLVITLIGPLLILAVSILPGLLTEKTMAVKEGTVISLVGISPALCGKLEAQLGGRLFHFKNCDSSEEARQAVINRKSAGALIFEDEAFFYLSRTATDIVTYETLRNVANRLVIQERLEESGLDSELIQELSKPPEWTLAKVYSDETSGDESGFLDYIYTALGFVMLLYMTILLYGQMIGRSVVIEKTSKTVEIMLSSVKPSEMMFGKILGLGVAGLIQYLFWISVSLIVILIAGPFLELALPASLTPGNLGFLFIFFLLAFFLYASIYSAIGAASEDEQHLGQLSWPLIMFLVIPMLMVSALVANPDGTLAVVLSFFPLTGPVVMLIRVLVQMPSLWEFLIFFIIMLVSIFIAVVGSGKIFRICILLSGKRMTIKEVLKLL